MINLNSKKQDGLPVSFTKIIWKSTILAMIFALPALGIFISIYYSSGNLIAGAILGFGVHFATLAFSDRISNRLVKFLS